MRNLFSGALLTAILLASVSSVSAAFSEQNPSSIASCSALSQRLLSVAKTTANNEGGPYYPSYYAKSAMQNMGTTSAGISSTYTRTEGIDEIDSVKVTSRYIANIIPFTHPSSYGGQAIDIRDTKGGLLTTITGSLLGLGADQYLGISGILATDDKLVVIVESPLIGQMAQKMISPYVGSTNATSVVILDVKDLSHPKVLKQIGIPNSTRQAYISNGVLTLSSYGISGYNPESAGKYSIPRVIEKTGEKAVTRPITCANYQFFSGALENQTQPQISIFLTQDLADLTQGVKDSGFIGNPDAIYFSGDKMYTSLIKNRSSNNSCPLGKVCAAIWNPTNISSDLYGFSLKNGIYTLEARTTILGSVRDEYSLNRDKNIVTVISSEQARGAIGASSSRLSTYDAKTLKRLGTISNIAPGEQLGGVKFLGKNVYFITYRQTDPVFKVSLANPEKPKILGALKIPGFSNQLISYDDNHIIAIGMDTKISTGSMGEEISTTLGVKFDLYNMENDTPKLVSSKVMGGEGSWLTSYDPRGVIWDSTSKKLSLPVILMHTGSEKLQNMVGAVTIQVSPVKGFELIGKLRTDSNSALSKWFNDQCGNQAYTDPEEKPVWCTREFSADTIRKNRFANYQYQFSADRVVRYGDTYFLRSYDKSWIFDTSKPTADLTFDGQNLR